MSFPHLYEYWVIILMSIMRAIFTIRTLVLFPIYSIYYFIYSSAISHPNVADSKPKISNEESIRMSDIQSQDLTSRERNLGNGKISRDLSKGFLSTEPSPSKKTKLSRYTLWPNGILVHCYSLFGNTSSENESPEREKKREKKKEKTKNKNKKRKHKSPQRLHDKRAENEQDTEGTLADIASPSVAQQSSSPSVAQQSSSPSVAQQSSQFVAQQSPGDVENDGSINSMTITSDSVWSDDVRISDSEYKKFMQRAKEDREKEEREKEEKKKKSKKESVQKLGNLSIFQSMINMTHNLLGYRRVNPETEFLLGEPEPQIPSCSAAQPAILGCSATQPAILGCPASKPQIPDRPASEPQQRRKSSPQPESPKSARIKVKEVKDGGIKWHQRIFRRLIRKPEASSGGKASAVVKKGPASKSRSRDRIAVKVQEQDICLDVSGSDSSSTDNSYRQVEAETVPKTSKKSGSHIFDGVIEVHQPEGHLQVSSMAPNTLEIHFDTPLEPAKNESPLNITEVDEICQDALENVNVSSDHSEKGGVNILSSVPLEDMAYQLLEKELMSEKISIPILDSTNVTESSMDMKTDDRIRKTPVRLSAPLIKTPTRSPTQSTSSLKISPKRKYDKNLGSELESNAEEIDVDIAVVAQRESKGSPNKMTKVEKLPSEQSSIEHLNDLIMTIEHQIPSIEFENVEDIDSDSESTSLLKSECKK